MISHFAVVAFSNLVRSCQHRNMQVDLWYHANTRHWYCDVLFVDFLVTLFFLTISHHNIPECWMTWSQARRIGITILILHLKKTDLKKPAKCQPFCSRHTVLNHKSTCVQNKVTSCWASHVVLMSDGLLHNINFMVYNPKQVCWNAGVCYIVISHAS